MAGSIDRQREAEYHRMRAEIELSQVRHRRERRDMERERVAHIAKNHYLAGTVEQQNQMANSFGGLAGGLGGLAGLVGGQGATQSSALSQFQRGVMFDKMGKVHIHPGDYPTPTPILVSKKEFLKIREGESVRDYLQRKTDAWLGKPKRLRPRDWVLPNLVADAYRPGELVYVAADDNESDSQLSSQVFIFLCAIFSVIVFLESIF